MTEAEVADWFAGYLAEFAALGRGDVDDERRILAYYGVPLLLSSDAGTTVLTDEEQVLDAARRQVAALRADDYARSDQLFGEATVLNRTCALYRGRFVRYTADDAEITRLETSYLIAVGPDGPRITSLVFHS